MDDIKNIVKRVIGGIAEKTPNTHNKIERLWQNILTQQELKHTHIIGVKQGTLLINVDSPAWLYQMKIQQTKIIKRLKEELSDIKCIYFKLGKI